MGRPYEGKALDVAFVCSVDGVGINIADADLSSLALALMLTIIIEYGVLRLLRERRRGVLCSSVILIYLLIYL